MEVTKGLTAPNLDITVTIYNTGFYIVIHSDHVQSFTRNSPDKVHTFIHNYLRQKGIDDIEVTQKGNQTVIKTKEGFFKTKL